MKRQTSVQFMVGDKVTWASQRRIKDKVVTAERLSGQITSIGKGFVIVRYAGDKLRQVWMGTLGLEKVNADATSDGVNSESAAIAED